MKTLMCVVVFFECSISSFLRLGFIIFETEGKKRSWTGWEVSDTGSLTSVLTACVVLKLMKCVSNSVASDEILCSDNQENST